MGGTYFGVSNRQVVRVVESGWYVVSGHSTDVVSQQVSRPSAPYPCTQILQWTLQGTERTKKFYYCTYMIHSMADILRELARINLRGDKQETKLLPT